MIINTGLKDKMSIAYSKNQDVWREFGRTAKLETIEDFKKVVGEIRDVCFISGCGVGFLTKDYTHYQFIGLTPKLLEELAEGFFFDKESNAKMWYCCLRYAVENADCAEFWYKYKETSAGPKFMAIMLGSKNLDEN
jgi:hypothetical protein